MRTNNSKRYKRCIAKKPGLVGETGVAANKKIEQAGTRSGHGGKIHKQPFQETVYEEKTIRQDAAVLKPLTSGHNLVNYEYSNLKKC